MAVNQTFQILWVGETATTQQWNDSPSIRYKFISFVTLRDALNYLTRHPAIDSIILNGLSDSVAKLPALRAIAPKLPIMVWLRPGQEDLGLEAIRAGADEYVVTDSATFAPLKRAVRCAIERDRRMRHGAALPSRHRASPSPPSSPEVTSLISSEQLYRSVFEGVPVSLWEEDWTAVIALIKQLQAQGVNDFARYLNEHPEFVRLAIQQVRILDVNEATLTIFKAQNKTDILNSLEIVFSTPDTWSGFKRELLALVNGERGLSTEMKLRTVTGEPIEVLLSMTFPPPASSSGLVLVSLMDITPLKQTQTQLANRVRQQEAVAQLGLAAAGANHLLPILQQATEKVAAVLKTNFGKVLALAEDGSHLQLVAGIGWSPGLVGTATVGLDRASQAGFTLQSPEPVYVNDLSRESRFTPPPLLIEHGIVSGMSVAIWVQGKPWGVLAVHDNQSRQFSQDDTYFLQSVASLLALLIERLTAQAALQESHRQMQEAQNIAALGSWEYDFVRDRMHWSESCFAVTGLDPAAFVPTYAGCFRHVHPDDQERAQRLVDQAIRDHTAIDFEHRWLTPTGETYYLHERGQIIYDDKGQPLRMLGTFQDITSRKRAEDMLLQQATLLRNAERIGHMGSWDMDLVKNQLLWSEGTYRLFGMTAEDLQGGVEQFLSLVLPEDRSCLLKAHRESDYSTTGFLDVKYRIRRADGEIRWLYERGHVEFDSTGKAIRRLGMVMDITEQKKAEAALKESEERFQQLFRDAATGIAVTTLKGQFLEANTAYCQMLGYSQEELQQLNCIELTHPSDRHRNQVLAQELLQGQRHSFVVEKRYLAKSGDTIWCRLSVSLQRNAAGQPVSMIGVAEDITQQRQVELSLQHSQRMLRMACQISHIGAWWVDLPERQLTWSDKVYDILELPRHHVPKLDATLQYYLPGEREKIRAAFEACIQSGTGYDLSLRIVTAQGNPRWTRSIGTAVRDASGRIMRVQGAFQDISAQKTAEQELRSSEERFRLLSKATNDAIWDWDLTTNANWRGEGFKTFFGYDQADITETHTWWREQVHPDDQAMVLASLRAALERGAPKWSEEYRFRCRDGSYAYVFDRGYIIRNQEGHPIRMIGGMVNLTQQKSLEAQLRQSQKMEAVGQLAGGIAHDFNNLLTIILGCSEMLLSMVPTGDPMWAIANDIYIAGDRASELTRQLLAFSRKQMLKPQVMDLNQVVSNLEKLLRRLISEDIHLKTQLATPLPSIEVDPGQLEQVILNLVLNARDAMPHGGKLTIETHCIHVAVGETLGKLGCPPGTYVTLTISDTGYGMAPEVQDRIFEPFFTTKAAGQGTGLGLATVFGIVKQSDGFIEVFSELGLGTRFQLLFPAIAVSALPMPSKATPIQPGSETILLIEDEAGVRHIAKRILERLGYQIIEAENGVAALEIMQNSAPFIHLIITDVVMPEMSGRELVEQLQQQGDTTRVLYMSGYTDDAVVRHGVTEETNAFLQKPFTPSSLAQKVREVLDQP